MQAEPSPDTLTWICCGSKVAAPSVKQPHIYYNRSDMTSSLPSALIRLPGYGNSQALTEDSEEALHLLFNLSGTSVDCFRGRNDDKSSLKEKHLQPNRAHFSSRAVQHMINKSDVVCLFCWFCESLNWTDWMFSSVASNFVYSYVPCGPLP